MDEVSELATVAITETAMARILAFRASAPDPHDRCLYVRIAGAAGGEYRHALSIEPLSVVREGDARERVGELEVVIPHASAARLAGATIDWSQQPHAEAGFTVVNPNVPTADDVLAERVREVLDEEINPSIALHGGRADLVAVEGRTAYMRLSGGCQGCGQAAATLAHGIEATLVDAVPEIVDVVDVTDHMAGTNPYYAPTG